MKRSLLAIVAAFFRREPSPWCRRSAWGIEVHHVEHLKREAAEAE